MLKLRAIIATLALVGFSAIAVSSGALAQRKPTIGIAMPTKSSARWIDDGNNIVKVLRERGYGTDLQYAEDDSTSSCSVAPPTTTTLTSSTTAPCRCCSLILTATSSLWSADRWAWTRSPLC